MRILAVSHQADAGLGVFADVIRNRGEQLLAWEPASGGGPAPTARDGWDAAIVLGGAVNVDERDANPWLAGELDLIAALLAEGVPLLGVCLGSQLLATAAGGAARRAAEPEIGWFGVDVNEAGAADPVVGPLAPAFEAFQWHSYECELPKGAVELATSPICPQAYRIDGEGGGPAWGVQFHPEVSRADALHWIDDYRSDPDAIRIGIDPEALRAETEPRLDAWNDLGRDLCTRFLDEAHETVTRRGQAPPPS